VSTWLSALHFRAGHACELLSSISRLRIGPVENDGTDILFALIEGNEQFLQMLVDSGMGWWVSTVAFVLLHARFQHLHVRAHRDRLLRPGVHSVD